MPQGSGNRLGHYEILSPLGAGGMGEVYRARDTKLNREVAIKMLPQAFATDPERMARFGREAQVLASLNHPNIAAIYGVEEQALVMELVDGPMLSDRIAQRPIPVEEAAPIIEQLIDALEYAHEKGVVHRDLKPANIKITPEGRVKVLDFGLAKALAGETPAADPASSPTITMHATMAGAIMGTAGYMSPEQVRGQSVDKRADIWAFGVVLYEMLTGRQLFGGRTVSDTLAAVLKDEPAWAQVPEPTRRLVRACLVKDARRRLQHIGDARLLMQEPPAAQIAAPRRMLPWALGPLIAAGLVLGVIHFRERGPVAPLMRFQVPVPESMNRMALSPDGLNLAYVATDAEDRTALWNRPLNSLEARMLTRADLGSGVFWSADSRWIVFVADGKLKKIEAAGGPPQTLCGISPTVPGGAWNRDGIILFGSTRGDAIYKVSQTGGDPVQVTASDQQNQVFAAWPQFLPDGRHFIYFAGYRAQEKTGIYVGELDGKQSKRLLPAAYAGVYVPPISGSGNGHLLFLAEATLMARMLDTRSLDLTGEAFPLAEEVSWQRNYGFFSASETGVLAYRSGGRDLGTHQLKWFDRTGKELDTLMGPAGRYGTLSLSPDGKRVAIDSEINGNTDLWLIDVQRGASTRFTTDPAYDSAPVWSPDGNRLFFLSGRVSGKEVITGTAASFYIYQKETGGVAGESLLSGSGLRQWPESVSPDGRLLLVGVSDPKTSSPDLWILPLDGEHKPVPFVQTPFHEVQGQFSPAATGSSHWVAYASDESGTFEVYVQSYPAGLKYPISKGGGSSPRWRADGKELFYLAPGGAIMSVQVKTSPRFEASLPRTLFHARGLRSAQLVSFAYAYAVAPDGNRFLINTLATGAEPAAAVTVVLNWQAGIAARK